jgi:hypothetical protein
MTKACIHFGSHNHLVSSGDCHESIMITKELARHELEKNPCATISAIVWATSKTFLNHELFVFIETPTMKLQGANFHGLVDKFFTFSSPNIKNLISSFWHGNSGCDPLDNILELKEIVLTTTSKTMSSLDKVSQKFTCSKCSQKVKGMGLILLHICN